MANNQPSGRRRRRRKFSPLKALRFFSPIIFFIVLCVILCTSRCSSKPDAGAPAPTESAGTSLMQLFSSASVYDLEATDTVSIYKQHLDQMPEPTERIHVNYFGDMRKAFNDSNYIHWAEAETYGIQPLSDTRSHWQLRRPIVKVTSCEDFFVDTLIYSRPYLVPEAAGRLHEIGRRFRDSITARGGGDYRIKVTSLLRTPQTVKRLRRRNRNAIDSSVHQLGTTFDISYAAFVAGAPNPARSTDDLKGILGEVLRAMRNEGKIWVKYERGQPCFHITARSSEQ
ncbi:MAG: hypothetical protein J1E29_03035 [Duncaniella sp.]|nr:hypothetical protein [Duncaniella sp.]